MASSLFYKTETSFFILLLYLLPLMAEVTPSSPISVKALCNSTPHPHHCYSILPINETFNIHSSAYFSIRKSLFQSRKFFNLIDKYLAFFPKLTPIVEVHALQDCRLLARLNKDFLFTSFQTLKAAGNSLPFTKAQDIQTMLSAVLTNQQTCLEGIQATLSSLSIKKAISIPLSDDTKLYRVSLALFTKGWVPQKQNSVSWQPTKPQCLFRNGRLPLKMSSRNQAIYDEVRNGRVSQESDDDSVLVSDVVTVSKDGSGNFTTIKDAIHAAPKKADGVKGYFLIYVKAGVYEEHVSVGKKRKYVMMIGDGINQTVITGKRSTVDGCTPYKSATFGVVAANFVAVNITFRNTAGAIKRQAVALRSNADLSTFYSCSFEGYEGTLHTHSKRQFYRECDIYGTLDFIFGNAAAVFQNCNIYPRLPLSGQFDCITAQSRKNSDQNTGISIHNCTIKAADDLASSNQTVKTYLGRPWKKCSRTVYMQSFMDELITPVGWRAWGSKATSKELYYGEYANRGPGSNTTNRVTWPGYHIMNDADATAFTVSGFLTGDAWLPPTGVPYEGGLI